MRVAGWSACVEYVEYVGRVLIVGTYSTYIQILVELMRKWVFRDPIVPLALKGIFAVSTGQETHPFSSDFRNNSTGYCTHSVTQLTPHTKKKTQT
jgi:hypothetical protein